MSKLTGNAHPVGSRKQQVLLSLGALLFGSEAFGQQLPPPTFGVRGTVWDVTRRPVSDAEVRLILDSPRGATLADTVASNEQGKFAARGWLDYSQSKTGPWRIEVRAEGFATSVLDKLRGGFGEYDVGPIYLLEAVTVAGVVLDDRGRPVAEAKVHTMPGDASWSREDASRRPPECVTDSSGRFECRTLAPGIMSLGISAPGYADFVLRSKWLSETNWLDIRLEPESQLRGVVLDDTGAPVPGASVDAPSDAFWRTSAATDGGGHFEVHGLAADWKPSWSVRALGFVPATREDLPQDDSGIVLRRSRSVIIRAVRDGTESDPVLTRLTIHDNTPPGLCGLAYGHVDLDLDPLLVEVLAPSRWRLFLDAALYPLETRYFHPPASGLTVRMADGSFDGVSLPDKFSHDLELTVHARRTGGLAGRVVDLRKRPIPGTTVMTNFWSVVEPHLVAVTDADGRFSFEGMASGGLHDIAVNNGEWIGRLHAPVTPNTITSDLELLVAQPSQILGRVTVGGAAPGEPIVIGLGEFQDHYVVPGGCFGLGISDDEGNYQVRPYYARRFTVVPKTPATPSQGGYRRFLSEFPDTPRGDWPWEVGPVRGEVRFDFDLSRK